MLWLALGQTLSSSIYAFSLNGVIKGRDFISKVSGENSFQFNKQRRLPAMK